MPAGEYFMLYNGGKPIEILHLQDGIKNPYRTFQKLLPMPPLSPKQTPKTEDKKEAKKFSITVSPKIYAMLQVLADDQFPAPTPAQIVTYFVTNRLEEHNRDETFRAKVDAKLEGVAASS